MERLGVLSVTGHELQTFQAVTERTQSCSGCRRPQRIVTMVVFARLRNLLSYLLWLTTDLRAGQEKFGCRRSAVHVDDVANQSPLVEQWRRHRSSVRTKSRRPALNCHSPIPRLSLPAVRPCHRIAHVCSLVSLTDNGGATVLKVGVQFFTPTYCSLGGHGTEHCTCFTIAIMTSKRLPAPNEIT